MNKYVSLIMTLGLLLASMLFLAPSAQASHGGGEVFHVNQGKSIPMGITCASGAIHYIGKNVSSLSKCNNTRLVLNKENTVLVCYTPAGWAVVKRDFGWMHLRTGEHKSCYYN